MPEKIKTIGLVVLLLSIATGGYLLWSFTKEPEPNIPLDWRTFENVDYGYEIQFPTDWYIEENNPDTSLILGEKAEHIVDIYPHFYSPMVFPYRRKDVITITIWPSDDSIPLCRLLEKKENDYRATATSIEPITINGSPARRYESETGIYYNDFYCLEVILDKTSKTYQFSYYDDAKEKQHLDIFNKVVSSFELSEPEDIDTSSDLADWRRYKNSQCGFAIKYPPNFRMKRSSRPSANIVDESEYEFKSDTEDSVEFLQYIGDLEQGVNFGISVHNDSEGKVTGSKKSFYYLGEEGEGSLNEKRVILNGLPGYQFEYGIPGEYYRRVIRLIHDDKVFVLSYGGSEKYYQENQQIFESFLQSLTFLE